MDSNIELESGQVNALRAVNIEDKETASPSFDELLECIPVVIELPDLSCWIWCLSLLSDLSENIASLCR